jgi:hypothetical protein
VECHKRVVLHAHLLPCIIHHHSKRAVLCIDMPYTIQRSLCVTNGHRCVTVMVQWPLWPSRTHRASQADTQLCCVGTRCSNLAIPCHFLYKGCVSAMMGV